MIIDDGETQSVEERLMAVLGNEHPDDEPEEEQQEDESADVEVKAEDEEADSEEETAEPIKVKLKRGDEEVEVDLEEAKNLAQQGYDYTKKTQEVAEQRKQVEMYAQALKAQEQTIQQQAALQAAFIKEIAKVESINEQIAQYESLDWNALSDTDPVQAQKLYFAYQQLQNKRAQAQQEIQQKSQTLNQHRQQQQAMALEQAKAELLKIMPDFNNETRDQIKSDAVRFYGAEKYGRHGLTAEALGGIDNPVVVKILRDALEYNKLKAEKANITKRVADKPAVVKPGAKDTNVAKKSANMQLRQQLKKSGRHEDAAALIERML